jgi:putative flippase GtrA
LDEAVKIKDWLSTKFADERVRYILVGAVNTLFGFLFFVGSYLLLKDYAHYLVIFLFVQVVAVTFSHFMQRKIVWKSNAVYFPELMRFSLTYVFAAILNVGLLWLSQEFFSQTVLLSQFIIGTLLIPVMFLFQKYWTFHSRHEHKKNS